jgi:hypothetical protein
MSHPQEATNIFNDKETPFDKQSTKTNVSETTEAQSQIIAPLMQTPTTGDTMTTATTLTKSSPTVRLTSSQAKSDDDVPKEEIPDKNNLKVGSRLTTSESLSEVSSAVSPQTRETEFKEAKDSEKIPQLPTNESIAPLSPRTNLYVSLKTSPSHETAKIMETFQSFESQHLKLNVKRPEIRKGLNLPNFKQKPSDASITYTPLNRQT